MSGVRRPSFPQNLCRILVRRIVSVALSHCLPVCFLIPIELSLLLCLTQLQPLFAILVQNHHLLDLNLLDVWTSERNQGKQAHPVLKYRVQHGSHCCAAGICQHQRQRSKCKECGGAGICRFFARKLLNPKSLFAQEGRRKSSHTQPCPGPGERQGWRGGKGHDVHTGMTYNIVARQECGICVSHLYKWALMVVNWQGV